MSCYKKLKIAIRFITSVIQILLIVFEIIMIQNNCNQTLKTWSIMALVSHSYDICDSLHVYLQSKYRFFVPVRRSYKRLKVCLALLEIVFGWVLIAIALGLVIPQLGTECSETIHSMFLFVFVTQFICSCAVTMIMMLIICLLCVMQLFLSREDASGVSHEAITQNTVVKAFSEWIGITDNSCAICMEEYKSSDKITKLKCEHFFHENCIGQWLEKSSVCPFCRQQITAAEDKHGVESIVTVTDNLVV